MRGGSGGGIKKQQQLAGPSKQTERNSILFAGIDRSERIHFSPSRPPERILSKARELDLKLSSHDFLSGSRNQTCLQLLVRLSTLTRCIAELEGRVCYKAVHRKHCTCTAIDMLYIASCKESDKQNREVAASRNYNKFSMTDGQ